MGALVGRINAADQGVGKALCRNSPGNAQGDWRIAGNASAHRAMICVSAEILWAKLMGGQRHTLLWCTGNSRLPGYALFEQVRHALLIVANALAGTWTHLMNRVGWPRWGIDLYYCLYIQFQGCSSHDCSQYWSVTHRFIAASNWSNYIKFFVYNMSYLT